MATTTREPDGATGSGGRRKGGDNGKGGRRGEADAPKGAIGAFARFVLAHRKLVIAAWIVAFLAGAFGASHVSKRLSFDFSLPGQPGYQTALKIAHTYGNGGDSPSSVIVVTVPRGETVQGDQAQIAAAFQNARTAIPKARIVDLGSTHDERMVTNDGRSTYAIVFAPLEKTFGSPKVPQQVTHAVARSLPAGATATLTGLAQLQNGGESQGPGVFVETLIGGAGALAVLAFVFASALALLPLLIAAVAILTTLLVVLALTYVAELSFVVQFLVSLVGLGVAIDYSLLIVTRWREERDNGRDNEEAVVAAMAPRARRPALWAHGRDRARLTASCLPMPSMRSVGYGGMLIPLVSTGVALTLLPALLGGIGPRVDWPSSATSARASRGWTAWASPTIVRHRGIAATVAIVLLGLLLVPLFSLTTGQTSASALAKTGAARAAYHDTHLWRRAQRRAHPDRSAHPLAGRDGRRLDARRGEWRL